MLRRLATQEGMGRCNSNRLAAERPTCPSNAPFLIRYKMNKCNFCPDEVRKMSTEQKMIRGIFEMKNKTEVQAARNKVRSLVRSVKRNGTVSLDGHKTAHYVAGKYHTEYSNRYEMGNTYCVRYPELLLVDKDVTIKVLCPDDLPDSVWQIGDEQDWQGHQEAMYTVWQWLA